MTYLSEFVFKKLVPMAIPFLISLLKRVSSRFLKSLPPSSKKDSLEGIYGDFCEKLWILEEKLQKNRENYQIRQGKSRLGQIRHKGLVVWQDLYKLVKIAKYGISFGLSWCRLSVVDWSDTLWKLWVAFDAVSKFDGSINQSVVVATRPLLTREAAYIELGKDGCILEWSESAQVLFGYETEAVINRSSLGIIIPTDLEKLLLFQLLKTPEQYKLNINQNLDVQGRQFELLWLNFPIYQQFKLERVICVGVRISSPRLAQRLIWIYRQVI